MFTGLIESLGEVTDLTRIDAGYRVRIRAGFDDLREGESIAVNGVCVTAINPAGGHFEAELGPETSRVTSLGAVKPGSRVNLERAMKADSRFGGHFVLGHVDGTGTVMTIRPEADFTWVTFSFPEFLAAYMIHRGSIAVDGISLTIAGLSSASFDVQIVPFTWTHTNLQTLKVGDRVNLECDMVGKYVVRAVELMGTKV